MKLFGYLAVAAAVASLLIVSSGFTERRSVPTWAPNAVVAKPTPAVAAIAAVAAVPAAELKAAPAADPKAAPVETPAAPPAAIAALPASRYSTPDPDATGTLPKELDGPPKVLPEAAPTHAPREPRQARTPRQTAPRLSDAAPARQAPPSREPIQFRLAEGRN
ncbi:MAG TPA: hypothetical protein VKB16_03845 [Beijerinckiaceae bacterium]|nr:hypothetical protein [Beijerinckiaceae bacterium]